FFGN
ncbi:hypothetical protein JL09_g6254, partial [Pichia kudriavzevii]